VGGRRSAGGAGYPSALELPQLARQVSGGAAEADEEFLAQASSQSGKWWLQVWDMPAVAGSSPCKVPEPLASAALASPVISTDVDIADEGLVLCGLASGGAELRSLPEVSAGSRLQLLRAWPGEVAEGPACHVLLRAAAGSGRRIAVVARQGCVMAHDATGGSSAGAASSMVLLPAQAPEGIKTSAQLPCGEGCLRVAALRPVGARGFAVCSDVHVYAFQACSGGELATLTAVVELPTATLRPGLAGPLQPAVRHFEATPYEFLAVLDEAAATCPEANAVCCLWPQAGDFEDESLSIGKARFLRLRAWAQGGSGAVLRETMAVGLCLNSLLFAGQEAPSLSALALHTVPEGPDLLAVAAPGTGVAVFHWGVEASPHVQQLREKHQTLVREQARRRELDSLKRQLGRLQQRLQETERLEKRAEEQGVEALTEEEQAKLQRRGQMERECERLCRELGLEQEESETASEDEAENASAVAARPNQGVAAVAKRREKEKQQKEHHENKRAVQKERRQKREQKYDD